MRCVVVVSMAERDAANEELAGLLRTFGSSSRDTADAARRAFYHATVKTFDRQALLATGYNQELARQAMQEAWIKIMNTAGRYDPSRGKVMTWAKAIIMRCAMDELRAHYRHHPTSAPAGQGGDAEEGSSKGGGTAWTRPPEHEEAAHCPVLPAEERLYQDQVARITALCIEALPGGGPNYRLAMELALDPDLSYADMTALIQRQMPDQAINPEQVRGWVRYAAKRMRSCVSARLGLGRTGGQHG